MASLKFFYSSMNAGKTLDLIRTFFNFAKTDENHNVISDNIICLTSAKDNRFGKGVISSRPLDTTLSAYAIDETTNLYEFIQNVIRERKDKVELILVDESQFFSEKQINHLAKIVDYNNIDVTCYGLRTNFKGEAFKGSAQLLATADKIREIKNRCGCGKKATMNLLFDENGTPIKSGIEIQTGAEGQYISLCRKHFFESHKKKKVVF